MKAASSIWAKGLMSAFVLLCVSSMALAATDVSGTWTFAGGGARGGRGGGQGGNAGGAGGAPAAPTPAMMSTLILKQDGDKVTGTLTPPAFGGRNRGGAQQDPATPPPAPMPIAISNAKLEGDTLSFEVTQSRGGNDVTTKYKGKVEGDKITGEILAPGRNGAEPMPRPWTATKSKAAATK